MSTKFAKIEKQESRINIKHLNPKDFKSYKVMMFKKIFEQCSLCASLKNWITNFKTDKFSIEDDDQSGRTVSVSICVKIDAVCDTVLLKRLIRLKKYLRHWTFRTNASYSSCRFEHERNFLKTIPKCDHWCWPEACKGRSFAYDLHSVWTRCWFLKPCCHYWWNLGIYLRPRNKAAIDGMETLWFPKAWQIKC